MASRERLDQREQLRPWCHYRVPVFRNLVGLGQRIELYRARARQFGYGRASMGKHYRMPDRWDITLDQCGQLHADNAQCQRRRDGLPVCVCRPGTDPDLYPHLCCRRLQQRDGLQELRRHQRQLGERSNLHGDNRLERLRNPDGVPIHELVELD